MQTVMVLGVRADVTRTWVPTLSVCGDTSLRQDPPDGRLGFELAAAKLTKDTVQGQRPKGQSISRHEAPPSVPTFGPVLQRTTYRPDKGGWCSLQLTDFFLAFLCVWTDQGADPGHS
jgi:hypothetical protein